MPVEESCRLSWGDKNRIERAVDQVTPTSRPVRVEIEHAGKKYRVLVSLLLNKEDLLVERARAQASNR